MKKRNARSWTNLLALWWANELQDGTLRPIQWSPEIARPMVSAVRMAIQMTREWEPTRRASPKAKAPGPR